MDGLIDRVTAAELSLASITTARPHIVIIGAGFGGLSAAMRLGKVDADVTVIDRRNYHFFQPLLYQVATAALSPAPGELSPGTSPPSLGQEQLPTRSTNSGASTL